MPRWELAGQGRLLSNLRLGGAKSRIFISLSFRSILQRIGEIAGPAGRAFAIISASRTRL